MAWRRESGRQRQRRGLGGRVPPPGRAVLRAFRQARFSAPGFLLSCGVFPELSESASDRLHSIVHEVAERHLDKTRRLRALRTQMQPFTASRAKGRDRDARDRVDTTITALLESEATAAYLFGLAVGLAIRSLPDHLDR